MNIEIQIIDRALSVATGRLLGERSSDGFWQGRLSSSALATATAVFALSLTDEQKHKSLIASGLDWLSNNCNTDGGWGDSVMSVSNIPTTMLCWAAFSKAVEPGRYADTVAKTESWLEGRAGGLEPELLIEAVNKQYGSDRTFSVPILTMCALAGRLGELSQAWANIKALPFELAACPYQLFKLLRLGVVSYALPALIAMGQVNYHKNRPANPLVRLVRGATRRRTLKVLQNIQPAGGGFLEAVPLTSFVVMALVGAGQRSNTVVTKGIEFICNSVRSDGSWPIDTNLVTWLTTLSVKALAVRDDFEKVLPLKDRRNIRAWLLAQQYRRVHPYTHAEPGGWAWTDLSGGVPDADDTAGALIALRNLNLIDDDVIDAAEAGIKWLSGLQNKDGGIPTFCKGWLNLPFDRSAPDLTAHAITAFAVWQDKLAGRLGGQVSRSIKRCIGYLADSQNSDGSWTPLWFGNQLAPDHANPVYGSSRVLAGLQTVLQTEFNDCAVSVRRGIEWLLSAQNADGGWGGAKAIESSVEETALAVDALAGFLDTGGCAECLELPKETIELAVCRGIDWLMEITDGGKSITPSPIGLYFAKLWYFEKLYPSIFFVSALNKVKRLL
ncbi:MAG: prenyltransferase/squalene oxidase repeat-containing protein [Planctomycetota bacterium]|jgi:squalene-hopene/tetraprenyl-beta-curcumene cyclase